ncbi:MAG TPA: hypothetical protein DIC22_10495, partial [Chitinophagaceae bacterium]|nr:hypothetical protein [Chitinophagaceae bacterium]
GACLVDPENTESIRAGIKRIIEDDGYRASLVNKGFENIKQYDVQEIADQYLKLYAAILNNQQCVA